VCVCVCVCVCDLIIFACNNTTRQISRHAVTLLASSNIILKYPLMEMGKIVVDSVIYVVHMLLTNARHDFFFFFGGGAFPILYGAKTTILAFFQK